MKKISVQIIKKHTVCVRQAQQPVAAATHIWLKGMKKEIMEQHTHKASRKSNMKQTTMNTNHGHGSTKSGIMRTRKGWSKQGSGQQRYGIVVPFLSHTLATQLML